MNYLQAQKFILYWAKLGRKEYLKDPKKCGVYLQRLQYFLNLIDNPEKQIPHYIHVTGTSGKGSVCLILDSILRADKRRVGTMTSPEIGPTQTRWQINGQKMTDKELAEIITKLKPKLDLYLKTSPYDPISHFELMTAIGLYWFAQKKVKWCILEVGLGGRYDSTNIIPHKDIAVITNIGLDHTEILGKTKEKIAYEKAGIIKPGCKVFTNEQNKKLLKIFEKEIAKYKTNTKQILKLSCQKNLQTYKLTNLQTIFKYQNHTYNLNTLGEHQVGNAILAIEITKSLKIPYSIIKRGLEKIKLPLRMEIISKNPLIILDGAHNPDKMKTTVETVRKLISMQVSKYKEKSHLHTYTLIHLLTGFSADKDLKTMCQQLKTLNPKTIAITKFTSPFKKSAKPKDIEKLAKKYFKNTKIKIFSNPQTAYTTTKNKLKKNDLLLITGSLYLSGEIRAKLTKAKK